MANNYEWLTVPNKEQHEYIIGIDFGHGETSAAFCPIGWNLQDGELEGVKDIDFGNNSKVIPSAISITDDGRVYIGETAFLPEVLNRAKVNVCFKKCPKDINGEQEQLMIQYMRAVYQLICEKNNALFTKGNHIVCIAAPSGWSQEAMLLYGQMAHKAGLPIFGCVSESRAAFIKAQQDVSSGLPQYINQGAIVFDMGSSTLDFTYLRENEVCDYGYDCGASRVEKLIYSGLREDNEDIVSFEQQHPHLVAKLLFEARSAKEGVYFHPETRFKRTVNFEDIVDDEEFEDAKMKFIYEPGELNRTLQSNGYIDEIRRAMIDFKQNHINGKPIYVAFLTGGASRMDFIKPLVSECWGLPEDKIYRDQDPSLTISRGTADTGRMIARNQNESEEQVGSVDEQIEHWRNIIQNLTDEGQYLVGSNLRIKMTSLIHVAIGCAWDSFTEQSGSLPLIVWFLWASENANELDNDFIESFKETGLSNFKNTIERLQNAVNDGPLGKIYLLTEKSISSNIVIRLNNQLERIWSTMQGLEINDYLNTFYWVGPQMHPNPSGFADEYARIIVDYYCSNWLNGPLAYLNRNESSIGRFFDAINPPSKEDELAFAVKKELGIHERRNFKNLIRFSENTFRRENEALYIGSDGEPLPEDAVGQTIFNYVRSVVEENPQIRREIDKYVEMCNNALLTYFNSYVAELKSKL